MIPNIDTKLNIGTVIRAAFSKAHPAKTSEVPDTAASASPLLHPDLAYARGFRAASSSQTSRIPWFWLVASMLGIVGSTYTDIVGFRVVFPDSTAAAVMMAGALECFIVSTGIMLTRSTRRARKFLVAQAALFGITSIIFSVAGMNYGASQVQAKINAPSIALQAAREGEKDEAQASAQTELAALARIQNELSYLDKHSHAEGAQGNNSSGYAQDLASRRSDLLDLRENWRQLNPGAGLEAAVTADQVWTTLQHNWAHLADLAAETSKITAQNLDKAAKIPMPLYPTPPVAGSEEIKTGANDATGVASLFHPTPKTLFFLLIALVLDGGPGLIAASLNASERPDGKDEMSQTRADSDNNEPEPEGTPEPPLDIADDFNDRLRRSRRAGDDLRLDPLATAFDDTIARRVEAHRIVEIGALTNLTFMRSLEIWEEEAAILRDAAVRTGIKKETVERHLDASFARLQKQHSDEIQIQDGEAACRVQRILNEQKRVVDEQEHLSASDHLAVARQIAEIQSDLHSLGSRPR